MSLIDDISNRFFRKESVTSNIQRQTVLNRFSLEYNGELIPYHIGVKILKDTQVSTGFDILKYILSSKQYILLNNTDDTTVYDFILEMFNNMNVEITEVVQKLLPAILWGFSVSELIYQVNNDGRLVVTDVLPLHIKTLQQNPFTYNDAGELVSIHQEYKGETCDIPVNKVLVYCFNNLYDESYGHGLLHDFSEIVEDKVNINNWLMTFLERHESPTLVGSTDNYHNRDNMLRAFDDVKGGSTGIVVGENDTVTTLESSHRGETFFKTLQYKDNQIFRRYYLGNLLLGDNSQTGTYAQSQTQLDFGQLIFDGILEDIANTIQKQIINPIVEYNFGADAVAPIFQFDKFTHGDLHGLLTTLKPLIDSGIVGGDNDSVQDAVMLLFKQEAGLDYTPDEFPEYEFEQDITLDETEDTQEILDLMSYE